MSTGPCISKSLPEELRASQSNRSLKTQRCFGSALFQSSVSFFVKLSNERIKGNHICIAILNGFHLLFPSCRFSSLAILCRSLAWEAGCMDEAGWVGPFKL